MGRLTAIGCLEAGDLILVYFWGMQDIYWIVDNNLPYYHPEVEVVKRFKKFSRQPKWFRTTEGRDIFGSGHRGWRNPKDHFNHDWHYHTYYSAN